MNIFFHHSYNLDCLNLLNLLAGDIQLRETYPEVYAEFGQPLSLESREILVQVSSALGSTMISPPVAFGLSVIPQFDKATLLDLLLDEQGFQAAITQNDPRLAMQQKQLFLLFQVLAPVIQEIEFLGFREYWISEFLSDLDDRIDELDISIQQSGLTGNLHTLIPEGELPEEIHIYLCALAGKHAVRLTKHCSLVDISFGDRQILDFSLHEIIHAALPERIIEKSLQPLQTDSFVQLAFEKTRNLFPTNEILSYLKENSIEAFKVHLLSISGFLPDPFDYLLNLKNGAYVLAVILLDFLTWQPGGEKSMMSSLQDWMDTQPAGKLVQLYRHALHRAGKAIGD